MNKTISYIDINADVGEGIGNDAHIMPYISSCNIACGGHAGDEKTIRATIALAKEHGVCIGAHPSFPDRDNFGRKLLTMTKQELTESMFNQLLHFYAICETEDVAIHHIKLHGALYNYASKDAPTANAVVEAITTTKVRPTLYVQHGSVLHKKAENLVPLTFEAFIDRRYNDDLSLVSRTQKDAVIHSKEKAWLQLKQLVLHDTVTSVSGKNIAVVAGTYCIHGDHPNSVEILEFLHQQCKAHQIQLKP